MSNVKKIRNFIAILMISVFFLSPYDLISQEQCGDVALNNAKKKYETGNFDNVFSIINNCLETGFNDNEKVQAYRLLSLTYIALDSIYSANEAAKKLLSINPNFEADLFDPPVFIEMINNLKEIGNVTVITSVSKKAENIMEAPANVMIVTQEDIRNRGYVDLEQLFSDLPGFDVSRTYGPTYSNIYQRGYRSNNTDRTLFLVDGVEENDLWSNSIFWSRQYPISNVKRVEVVYGPASTMYGANALVGVVNVITKDAEELTSNGPIGIKANTGFGTYGTYFGDVTVSAKSSNISFSLTARRFNSDERDISSYDEFDYSPSYYDEIDYVSLLSVTDGAGDFIKNNNIADGDELFDIIRDQSTGDTISARLTSAGAEKARQMEKGLLDEKLNGKKVAYSNVSKHWFLYGKLKIFDFDIGFQSWEYEQGGTNYYNDYNEAGAENGSIWAPKQTIFYAKYNKAVSDNLLFMNFAQYRVSETADNSKAVYMINFSNGSIPPEYSLADLFYNGFTPYWKEKYYYSISRQFRNETKMHYVPNNDFDIVAGLEVRNSSIQGDYRTTERDDSSAVEIGVSTTDSWGGGSDFTIYDMGAYAQGTYKFTNYLALTLGGRYDYNRIRVSGGYGSQFNPRIALVATPSDFIFKVIYASAFQNASNWTKFSTNTSRPYPNPGLEPEKVSNIEINAGWKITNDFFADVLFYKSDYDGVVGTNFTSGKNEAIGALKIQGIQATMNYKYKNYSAYAHYTYTDPQNNILDENYNQTGDYQRIGDISSHKFNLGVNALFFDHLNVNLRMNYISSRPVGEGTSINNPGDFPSVLLLNGAISVNNIIKGLNVQFILNNITNLEYFDPGIRAANGALYSYRTPQRERNFILRLIYDL